MERQGTTKLGMPDTHHQDGSQQAVSRRSVIGGIGLAALSLLALPQLANASTSAALSGPVSGAYVVQSDGTDGGTELIQLLQNLPAGGIVIIPSGAQLVCSATVVISSPVVLIGYGASLQASHTQQNVLSIQSDDVFVYGLKLAGNPSQANENTVSIATGKGRITLQHIVTAGCLVGVSSVRRAHHLLLDGCVLNSSVHGAVLRLLELSAVEGCTVNDHPGSGATGIRIQGEEKTVSAIATATGSVTCAGHQLRAGDKLRFYAEGTVTLPGEIKPDTVYYAAGTITADQFQLSAYPGGPVLTLTGQNLSGSGVLKLIVVCSGITISGNRMSNNRAGVYLLHTDDSRIAGNDIRGGTCIQLENSWHNAVYANNVRDAADLGINLHRNSSFNVVSANQAHNCQNANIGLTIDVKVGISNNNHNAVVSNVCTGARPLPGQYESVTGSGVELNGTGAHNVVSQNELRGNARFGIKLARGHANTVIQGNQITKNDVGISAGNDFTSITDNQLVDNYAEGILISHPSASFLTITANAVKGNGTFGIKLGSETRLSAVQGNVVNGNGTALGASAFTDNRIAHNIYIEDGNKGTVRPTAHLFTGMMWYDTAIDKPVWYKGGGVWVDGGGNPA